MTQGTDSIHSFEYLTTKAHEGFQQNIVGLLELHQHLTERLRKTKECGWKNVSFLIEESELTASYLLRVIGELMGHHDSLNKCLLHLNKQQRITEMIVESQLAALIKKSTEDLPESKV